MKIQLMGHNLLNQDATQDGFTLLEAIVVIIVIIILVTLYFSIGS